MSEHDAGRDLAALQHWMLSAVTAGNGVAKGIAAACGAFGIDVNEVVVGSNRLPADQRVAIYARGYMLRLLECLQAEFPALRRLVGDQVFGLFAQAYIEARPSTSFTLYDLGGGFADFLEATRPAGCGRGSLEALPASLARLERARAEVQRARGVENEPEWQRLLSSTLALAPGARLRLPDSVRLLRLDFDFVPTLAAADRRERPDLPVARDSLVAVARSGYRVQVHTLEPARFAWLEALGTDGNDVLSAAGAAAQASGREAGAIVADLFVWLPVGAQAGLVTGMPG